MCVAALLAVSAYGIFFWGGGRGELGFGAGPD